MSKKLIVFIDSGDTLVNEGTEYRNEGSPIVQSCELIDGAKELLLTLKERGYTIELVADGYTQSFDNSYGQHGLKNIFDARTISEEVGEKKPSQAMFETAMKLLHLTDEEANRKFGHLIEAFRYGAPPHGGMGIGLDRLVMQMLGAQIGRASCRERVYVLV